MKIQEHQKLTVAIPVDLKKKERIQVSMCGLEWTDAKFNGFTVDARIIAVYKIDGMEYEDSFLYARRPVKI